MFRLHLDLSTKFYWNLSPDFLDFQLINRQTNWTENIIDSGINIKSCIFIGGKLHLSLDQCCPTFKAKQCLLSTHCHKLRTVCPVQPKRCSLLWLIYLNSFFRVLMSKTLQRFIWKKSEKIFCVSEIHFIFFLNLLIIFRHLRFILWSLLGVLTLRLGTLHRMLKWGGKIICTFKFTNGS